MFSLTIKAYANSWVNIGISNTKIQPLKTTPWGVVAGEFDSRAWLNPYNGIYISKDLGNTWNKYGLAGRGITDIDYYGENIYVSTYFHINNSNGIFVSEDAGNTWFQMGQNVSTANIAVYENNILQGTYNHGLWMSKDNGITWEQKLTNPSQILTTEANQNILMASTPDTVYISKDNGENWTSIADLSNKRIRDFEIAGNIILASSETTGMYRSKDTGETWEKLESWENSITGQIIYFEKIFYASGINEETNRDEIYYSDDFGNSWIPTRLLTNFDDSKVLSITPIFTYPHFLLTSISNDGLYKYNIEVEKYETVPFLEAPWQISSNEELIEKIYSYFDHEYPLINNLSFQEPKEFETSIVTFTGNKKDSSKINYSGHDGYDFSLNLGTPVLAAFSGTASYFWSSVTGNTITIDHHNGYKTLYGHLQDTDIVTNSNEVEVVTGQTIGLVGTTGITTGPHLHFSVEKDSSLGKTDPFGWQTNERDPWSDYVWEDLNGIHTGVVSKYLWTKFPEKQIKYVDSNGGEIVLNNKKIIVDQNTSTESFTIFVEPYEFPKVPVQQNKLVYITGTSMFVNMFNIIGKKPPLLLKPVRIEMDVTNANLDHVWENTLKFYFWDVENHIWEPLDSIWDVATKRLTGETYHFSHIAAFAELKEAFKDRVSINKATFSIAE